MERITAVACSTDGTLLAGGGASGALYLWDLASGRLLRTWAAHYKVPPPRPLQASHTPPASRPQCPRATRGRLTWRCSGPCATFVLRAQAVTALTFTGQADVLVSGSEDTMVNAWLVAELADCEADPSDLAHARPQPLHAW